MIRKIADEQVLSAAALVLPTLGFMAPLGIAPLLTLVALVLIALSPRSRLLQVRPFRPLAILLALLALWGALSTLWSTIPAHSLFESGRFVLLSASGIIVAGAGCAIDSAGMAKIGRASVVGLILGITVALIERHGDFALHRMIGSARLDRVYLVSVLDRGAVVLAMTCWIAVRHLILQRRPVGAGFIFAATLLTLLQLASHSALLGLLFAAASLAVAWWWPRLVAAAFAVGFATLTLVMPLVHPTREFVIWLDGAMPWVQSSGFHRLIIWRFASDHIAEHPLLGWGMDASRELPGGKMEVRDFLQVPADILYGRLNGAVMPLHPHDAILQWWLELGVVGAALGLIIFIWTIRRTGFWPDRPRVVRAAGLAVIAAALPPLLLDFGVWQAWWQSSLWFVAAFALAIGDPLKPAGSGSARAARP